MVLFGMGFRTITFPHSFIYYNLLPIPINSIDSAIHVQARLMFPSPYWLVLLPLRKCDHTVQSSLFLHVSFHLLYTSLFHSTKCMSSYFPILNSICHFSAQLTQPCPTPQVKSSPPHSQSDG